MTSMSRKTETRDRKAKRASANAGKGKLLIQPRKVVTSKAMPLEKYAEIKKMPPFLIWEEIKKRKDYSSSNQWRGVHSTLNQLQ